MARILTTTIGGAPPTDPPEALGWLALSAALERLYPDTAPLSWGPDGIHRVHDLRPVPENPLDGVEVYDAGDFWHYVSFGLSELYTKDSDDPGVSGFGYELTLRLGKQADQPAPPVLGIRLLVSLARAIFAGQELAPLFTAATGSLDGTAHGPTGLLVADDPDVPFVDGPFGRVRLYTLVLLSEATLRQANQDAAATLRALQRDDPRLISRLGANA